MNGDGKRLARFAAGAALVASGVALVVGGIGALPGSGVTTYSGLHGAKIQSDYPGAAVSKAVAPALVNTVKAATASKPPTAVAGKRTQGTSAAAATAVTSARTAPSTSAAPAASVVIEGRGTVALGPTIGLAAGGVINPPNYTELFPVDANGATNTPAGGTLLAGHSSFGNGAGDKIHSLTDGATVTVAGTRYVVTGREVVNANALPSALTNVAAPGELTLVTCYQASLSAPIQTEVTYAHD